ncbi:DUF1499 domain-containing protein [Saccharospirillum impatiens]|uniref:DUF1499 domain-containing protein n=1 Tax=Saccharospirillum impatiens TaxID=169438 RepID=UPI00040E9DFD|nr:DUF1499 domain-containing protein [Saccharospirillum impatiens]
MKTLLIILAVLIVLAFVMIYVQNSRAPSLGHSQGRLKPLSGKPNAVSTQAEDVAKRVAPWPLKADQEQTMSAIVSAVKAYGGAEVIEQKADYLYVVFTTDLMKFHDDAEFYLDTDAGEVHFRSSSRAGYSDRGLNRQRHERLTELYQQAQQ